MSAVNEVGETAALDLGVLLDAGEGAMVTLVAGETRLVAHRAVLAARSPVFEAMFRHNTLEASSAQVSITDVEGPALRQLLAYCYTLKAPLLSSMAPQLLEAADKYGLAALKDTCEEQVVAQLDTENAAATAVLAVRHSCPNLTQASIAYIKANNYQVLATQGWADAMMNHPQDLIQVSRLIAEALAKTSDGHGWTPGTTMMPIPDCHAPPTDEATVSHFRYLSQWGSGNRLIEAAKEGAVEELRALLAVGVDVETTGTQYSETALHWAADCGHEEVARCLLGAGAQVDSRDRDQETPLLWAVYRCYMAVVRLLLSASADPNARNVRGWTPLHMAACGGDAEMVAVLLEAGANRGARDDEGKTPLDVAREYNEEQLVQMLMTG